MLEKININELNDYGINLHKLEKGDVITTGQIELITNSDRNKTKDFGLKVLAVKVLIDLLSSNIGNEFTFKIHRNTIRVLTDSEANDCNDKRFKLGLRQANRSHYKLSCVDQNNLTENENKTYTRRLYVTDKITEMLKEKCIELEYPIYARKTPGLL